MGPETSCALSRIARDDWRSACLRTTGHRTQVNQLSRQAVMALPDDCRLMTDLSRIPWFDAAADWAGISIGRRYRQLRSGPGLCERLLGGLSGLAASQRTCRFW
jgi:hypothetical protein